MHLGSIAHRFAQLDATDPLGVGRYSSHRQYARSKLAVMLFGFELAERLADSGSSVSSVVAHPGLSLDRLSPARPDVSPARPEPEWIRPAQRIVAQGKDVGAQPLVHAAVGADVRSGGVLGPGGLDAAPGPGHGGRGRTSGARPHRRSAALGRERACIRRRVRSRRTRLTLHPGRMSVPLRRIDDDDHHL
ncbi:hypothetical protein WDV91_10430 [Curtobacterium flaccumfaciens pv. flaccumfaciens]